MIDPKDLIGLQASFELHGRRAVGIIVAAEVAPPFGAGKIPDYRVTVRGESGREVPVSMVETFMCLAETR